MAPIDKDHPHCIEAGWKDTETGVAFGTFVLVDDMDHVLIILNAFGRALTQAYHAAWHFPGSM